KNIPFHLREQHNIKVGDPIFIFDEEQLNRLGLSADEKKYVRPFYKNSAIKRGCIHYGYHLFVLYLNACNDESKIPAFVEYLSKFIAILNPRREVENGRIRWFDLWWPRERSIFESEKLVTSRRAKQNTFAYENMGTYPQSDITLITPKAETKESLKYLFSLLNSSFLNDWYGRNTKKKGNMREYYFTPLSKVPIRKIDFDNADEVKIHDLLGGIYFTQPEQKEDHVFDKITRTYIRQKGLADYYITLKKELYELAEAGFVFDPETELNDSNGIKISRIEFANYLFKNQIANIQFVRDVLLFFPKIVKNPTLYSFNPTERKEAESLLVNCTYFIKSETKDILIKGINTERMISLFAEPCSVGSCSFECSFDLITKENKLIEVEAKTKEDANWLVEMIQALLRKEKIINWEMLLSIPVRNQEMEKIIQEKRKFIIEALKPIDVKVKSRLDEIFQNREIEPLEKIKNIHYLQYLIDQYVNYLYSGD
ncbi:MAG: hypothetical protein EOM23_07000, partial [Candidatus Moranbacteria bacterium]|nr:hypothetical protein [Candidatus Moranbacteria bacterium]